MSGSYTRPDPDFYHDPTLQVIYSYGLNRPMVETDPLGLRITAVDIKFLDLFVCIAKHAQNKSREALTYVHNSVDASWEIRESDPDKMRTRESQRNYETANDGMGSTTERPGGIISYAPGTMWIDTRRPLDCVPIVTSMIHELWHAYQLWANPRKSAWEAHSEAKAFDRDEAKRICCACGGMDHPR